MTTPLIQDKIVGLADQQGLAQPETTVEDVSNKQEHKVKKKPTTGPKDGKAKAGKESQATTSGKLRSPKGHAGGRAGAGGNSKDAASDPAQSPKEGKQDHEESPQKPPARLKGPWRVEEKERFMKAWEKHGHLDGNDRWRKIAAMVKTRDACQVRTYVDRVKMRIEENRVRNQRRSEDDGADPAGSPDTGNLKNNNNNNNNNQAKGTGTTAASPAAVVAPTSLTVGVLLSQPQDKGRVSEHLFVAGHNFWLTPSRGGLGRCCQCRHCKKRTYFFSQDDFRNNVKDISWHLLADCASCPLSVRRELEKNTSETVWMEDDFPEHVWQRSAAPATMMLTSTKDPSQSPKRVVVVPEQSPVTTDDALLDKLIMDELADMQREEGKVQGAPKPLPPPPPDPTTPRQQQRKLTGRWKYGEKERFIRGWQMYKHLSGMTQWQAIAEVVQTRNAIQVRSFIDRVQVRIHEEYGKSPRKQTPPQPQPATIGESDTRTKESTAVAKAAAPANTATATTTAATTTTTTTAAATTVADAAKPPPNALSPPKAVFKDSVPLPNVILPVAGFARTRRRPPAPKEAAAPIVSSILGALLAQPEDKGKIPEYLFTTGHHFWLTRTANGRGRCCQCRHCKKKTIFRSPEDFHTRAPTLASHLQRDCPSCPFFVKRELIQAEGDGWMGPEHPKLVWQRSKAFPITPTEIDIIKWNAVPAAPKVINLLATTEPAATGDDQPKKRPPAEAVAPGGPPKRPKRNKHSYLPQPPQISEPERQEHLEDSEHLDVQDEARIALMFAQEEAEAAEAKLAASEGEVKAAKEEIEGRKVVIQQKEDQISFKEKEVQACEDEIKKLLARIHDAKDTIAEANGKIIEAKSMVVAREMAIKEKEERVQTQKYEVEQKKRRVKDLANKIKERQPNDATEQDRGPHDKDHGESGETKKISHCLAKDGAHGKAPGQEPEKKKKDEDGKPPASPRKRKTQTHWPCRTAENSEAQGVGLSTKTPMTRPQEEKNSLQQDQEKSPPRNSGGTNQTAVAATEGRKRDQVGDATKRIRNERKEAKRASTLLF